MTTIKNKPTLDVFCGGSPRDMGFAQGEALRETIAVAYDSLRELEAFQLMRPWWLPFAAFRRAASRKAAGQFREPLAKDCPEMVQRLLGMADGARITPEALYLMNGLEAYLCNMSDCLSAAAVASACSAVAMRGSRSADGMPVIARNFDYLPLIQPFYSLRSCQPTGGFRSLEFTIAPMCGAIDGMNEEGLCITYNYAYAAGPTEPAAPISMAICEAMARCRNVQEAADWICSRPRFGAGILMLADAEGDLASLELSSTHSELRRPAAGEDILCHTNSYVTDVMQRIEVPAAARYNRRVPTALRGARVLESSDRRDKRFEQLLSQTEKFGPDELSQLMGDHGPSGDPFDGSICMHSNYWNTTACVQLYPASRRMRLAYDSACQAEYAEFSL